MHHDHEHLDNPANELIATRLSARARRLDVSDTPVEVVVRRGRQRHQHRRTATSLLVVVGVCGSTIAAIELWSRPIDGRRITAAPPDAVDTIEATDAPPAAVDGVTLTPITVVESNLVWNRVDPESAEALGGLSMSMVGSGPFLTWSSAPGQRDAITPELWRSDDGQTWQQIIDPPPVSSGHLAEHDGRFFAYGTTPASAPRTDTEPAFDLALSRSDDGGLSWGTTTLPIDTSELFAAEGVSSVSVVPVAVAAGPQGVMVAARVQPFIEWGARLPNDVWSSGNWQLTADGVDVYAPGPCSPDTTVLLGTPLTTISGTFPSGTIPASSVPGESVPGESVPGESTTTVTYLLPTSTPTASTTGDATTTVVGAVEVTSVGVVSGTVPVATEAPVDCGRPEPLQVLERLTWADLGVDPAAGRASAVSPTRFYLSVDGTTFELVDAPPTRAGTVSNDVRLTHTGTGFVAWTSSYSPTDGDMISRLFDSVDGRTWVEAAAPPIEYPEGFDSLDGRLVVTGYSPATNGPLVSIRGTDASWSNVDLDDLIVPEDGRIATFGVGSASIGSTGITLIAPLIVDQVAEIGGVEMTRDGVKLRAEDGSGTFAFIDAATGDEIGAAERYASTTGGVTVSPVDGGFTVQPPGDAGPVTFSLEEVDRMIQTAYSEPVTPSFYVLNSADGLSWSRERLGDIAGEPIGGSSGVRQTETQVIIAANLAGDPNADDTPKQVLLIGTPRT